MNIRGEVGIGIRAQGHTRESERRHGRRGAKERANGDTGAGAHKRANGRANGNRGAGAPKREC